VIVSGSSMLPDARTGDVVLVWPSATYRLGDAVVFEVPDGQAGAGARVYHRIIDERDDGFVLQGDNNPFPDPWRVGVDDIVGREIIRVPGLGRAVRLLAQPAVLAAIAAGIVAARMASRSPAEPDEPVRRSGPGSDDTSESVDSRPPALTRPDHTPR